ncbi:hypothetical protein BBD41_15125 [Paenibacillus ihbetae]|uniref:Uncharacterized protein n=1 Tax=Paenibacillus ihbetae TaxID=1870820 RepID=A0A1B2E1J0_9BACL|nr:hypothetical protein BBD41_15125 [Paenibacillus ihbetae]
MSVLAAFLAVPVAPTVLAAQEVLAVLVDLADPADLANLVVLAAAKMPYNFTPSWDSCCRARRARAANGSGLRLATGPVQACVPYRQQIHSLLGTIL